MSSDPFGWGGIGIGRSGHVVAADSGEVIYPNAPVTATVNEAVNDPYEADPTGRLSGDLIYTSADLEAVLRANDFDSELLPQTLRTRIRNLLATYPEYRRALTTRSASDDTPPALIPGQDTLRSLVNIIESAGSVTLAKADIQQLIAPEIRLGRKLDVNRPLGNGVDDNGNEVIDEPKETFRADNNTDDDDGDGTTDEPGELYSSADTESEAFDVAAGAGTVPMAFQGQDPQYTLDEPAITPATGTGTFTQSQTNSRQILARNLYVLMMVLTRDLSAPGTEYEFPSIDPVLNPAPWAQADIYKARRLAQWAINVIDYRDPDSIMTRFPYDPNPFDGWGIAIDVDGDGTPDRYEGNATSATHTTPSPIVWGVEAPELMLTESVALHDVRVRDTIFDPSGENRSGMDTTTDQVRVSARFTFFGTVLPSSDGFSDGRIDETFFSARTIQ